jgi:hypothetical protein
MLAAMLIEARTALGAHPDARLRDERVHNRPAGAEPLRQKPSSGAVTATR